MTDEQRLDWLCRLRSELIYTEFTAEWKSKFNQALSETINRLMQDRPTGHWIAQENEEIEIIGYYCSICDMPMETEDKTKFCPHCGARMENI